MKYGFIYLWYDRKHKRFYLGCHWGTENDGYICSSSWMRNAYKRRPQDFKRRIIDSQIEKKDLRLRESVWLNMISLDELGKKYYNLMRHTNGGHWPLGKGRSEETKKKVSEGVKRAWEEGRLTKNSSNFSKGQIPWNKGKPMSEETKQKIRAVRQKQIFSQETIQKRSLKLKGKARNPDSIRKMVETKKERRLLGLYETKTAWNKGLDKNDTRVAAYADKQRGNQSARKKD